MENQAYQNMVDRLTAKYVTDLYRMGHIRQQSQHIIISEIGKLLDSHLQVEPNQINSNTKDN